ncbi:hypothetical protein ACP4OV_023796 [Aristida adscensionis]
MSGRRPPPSPAPPQPQPQPFRFWLPYRSNVGSWRRQPRSPPRPMPPPSQPPPTPPPTPAAPPPHDPPPRAVVEDIPVEGDSSDELDTISVESLDSPRRRRGRRASMADLELTLSGAPPTGQEQSSGRDGNGGNDTKIAISGFPRSRLFDGARAPYRREIEDGLKSLAGGKTPAARPESGQGYRVITLAGHNVGASMVLGNGGPRDAPAPGATATEAPESAARPPPVAANVNSNVQTVNNSSMEGSTCSAGSPGVHVDIKNAREEPAAVAPPAPGEETKPKQEPARRPPLVVTPQEKSTGGEAAAARTPARTRRCLRALMMENGSDTEAVRKPKPGACRFQCVAEHTPPATASSSGGAGGKDAVDGGKQSNKNDAS